jgi:hypothetical protein
VQTKTRTDRESRPLTISHATDRPDKAVVPDFFLKALAALLVSAAEAESLAGLVAGLMHGLRELGLAIILHTLESRDRALDTARGLRCPRRCGGLLRKTNKRKSRQRRTLLGLVEHKRRAWMCRRCSKPCFPLDEELGLLPGLRGHGTAFANQVVLLCTLLPFERACWLFEQMRGFAVSTTLARALTVHVGTKMYEAETKRAKALWEQRETNPERFDPPPAVLRQTRRHDRVYVMADNSKLGLQEGPRGRGASKGLSRRERRARKRALEARRKKAAKAKKGRPGPKPVVAVPGDDPDIDSGFRDVRAVIVFRDEDRGETSHQRAAITRRRVLAHVGTYEEFKQFLHMVFHEEGVYTAREVVVVADGGNGIWEPIGELLPTTSARKVIEVLDWYHASSHLWVVGRALHGHDSAKKRARCTRWVRGKLDQLAEGRVANVIHGMSRMKNLKGTAAEEVRKCIGYFKKHQRRMRYAFFRDRGLLIGSGAIESVHGWVIQARCRQPGMRWSTTGANAMLRLRCAWASGRWEEEFSQAAKQPPDGKAQPIEITAAA